MAIKKVALLTAGGLAPCLSSAVASLLAEYSKVAPEVEIIAYRNGYQGLLLGDSVSITPEIRATAHLLHSFGGSPIGNSRVKLTNIEDCVARGLVPAGSDPRQVAAAQLIVDGVDVLHTIGGDDTNTAAADLSSYLAQNNYDLAVVGLPKTIDNDIYPIAQSLGAWTAADEGARHFSNIVSEHTSNSRMLIVHEVMGRHSGWLTAATAVSYRLLLDETTWIPEFGLTRNHRDIHAVYVPELEVDLAAEATRLSKVLDEVGNVNIFLSEGAGVDAIVEKMRSNGEEIPVDPFGHVKIDKINPGEWFSKQFAPMIKAEKVLVQKSGYFARSAPANAADRKLIQECAVVAVSAALAGVSGLVGQDEDQGNVIRACEFQRVAGGKPFDTEQVWFEQLLTQLNQPKGKPVSPH
ncbi:MAG: pyrophosphate--fructose-6-phosphate 1-phosphotransferase [Candidatus Nanopelagicales bacterium]|jgi:diphosphate-dependent phosphofructokinase|nr:pyrophosphate--fructose-6-phosphate 1-phosphotransferase [Candidatus Nanopelagicales bacterium]